MSEPVMNDQVTGVGATTSSPTSSTMENGGGGSIIDEPGHPSFIDQSVINTSVIEQARKRREGERDELSQTPTTMNSNQQQQPPPANQPTVLLNPAPIPASSSQPKARASVEESPDRHWSRLKKQLGSGTFKDVYLGIDTESGKEVAWNVVDLKKVNRKDSLRIKQEIELLKSLRHPNIIQIFDSWEDAANEKLVFITERSAYTLKQHINNLHPAKTKVIKKYCRQILTALTYLHSLKPPVIHRDLKCDNIFCSSATGDAILGDFGLSIAKEAATSLIGTPGFLAPELFQESYNEKVDIWAFGMCVFEMATNSFPYVECNGVVSVLLKKGFEGIKPDGLVQIQDPALREFIFMCLQPVDKRPSAQQLLDQKVFDLTEEPKKTDINVNINQAATAIATPAPTPIDSSSSSIATPSTATTTATSSQPHPVASPTPQILDQPSALVSPLQLPSQQTPPIHKDAAQSFASQLTPSASSTTTTKPLPPPDSAASKLESLKRRADILIPKSAVAKTDHPAIVSIFLYARLREDMAHLNELMNDALTHPADVPDPSKLLLIDIPEYNFAKDNYLAVATNLVRSREELSTAALELENLEELIASKIEECVREKYNKFTAKARTLGSSAIMSLLTSLGMNLTYANKFIEQEVSYEDLFLLSDADLMEFIPKLGPRRRLQQFLDSEKTKQKQAAAAAAAAAAALDSDQPSSTDERERTIRRKSVKESASTTTADALRKREKAKKLASKRNDDIDDDDSSVKERRIKKKISSDSGDSPPTQLSSQLEYVDGVVKKKKKSIIEESKPTSKHQRPTQEDELTSPVVRERKPKEIPNGKEVAKSMKQSELLDQPKPAEQIIQSQTPSSTLSPIPSTPLVKSTPSQSNDSPTSTKRTTIPATVASAATPKLTTPTSSYNTLPPSSTATSQPTNQATTPTTISSQPTVKSLPPTAHPSVPTSNAPTTGTATNGSGSRPQKFFDPSSSSDVHMNALLSKISFELTGPTSTKSEKSSSLASPALTGSAAFPSTTNGNGHRGSSDSSPPRSRRGSGSSPITLAQLSITKQNSGNRALSPLPPSQTIPANTPASSMFTPNSSNNLSTTDLTTFDTLLQSTTTTATTNTRSSKMKQ